MPPAFAMFHRALPATRWKHQSQRFQLRERATLPRRPLRLETIKDWQIGILFAVGKVLPSDPLYIYQVAMSASSDALEASITSFSATKEGDVASSPSSLVNNIRSANRYFVCHRESAAACILYS